MMKQLAWSSLERVAYGVRCSGLWPKAEGHLDEVVLTYHNVISDHLFDASLHLGVSHTESTFRDHCRAIRDLQNEKRLPEKVVFTFDDGYQNQYTKAAKVLEEYDFRGIFFVSHGIMLSGNPALIDRILAFLSYAPSGEYDLLGHVYHMTPSNRLEVWVRLYADLVLDYLAWNQLEDEIERQLPFTALPIQADLYAERFTPMTSVQLADLCRRGHWVASHGWSHLPLRALPDDQLAEEFARSRQASETDCNCTLFAYPYGGVDEVDARVAAACRAAGFSEAYLNTDLIDADWHADFARPRISLGPGTSPDRILLKCWGVERRLRTLAGKMRRH